MKKDQNFHSGKLEYLNNLRGIAILMVVFVHSAQAIPDLPPLLRTISAFGQFGVQLFFILSAYTLCLSMEKRQEEDELTVFYLRRFFWIAPLYYIGIFLYLLLSVGLNYMAGKGNCALTGLFSRKHFC